MHEKIKGKVFWTDLTVPSAEGVSEFYREVLGWEKQALSMGDYDDYVMKEKETGEVVAGICHAKGGNSDLPPQWLIYIRVDNLDAALRACEQGGGKVIGPKRKMGGEEHFCLIQDPAGAYLMLCG